MESLSINQYKCDNPASLNDHRCKEVAIDGIITNFEGDYGSKRCFMGNDSNKRNSIFDIIYMLPAFIFIISIMLVRLHLFSMPLTNIFWTEALDTSTLSDLFSYWKAMVVIASACLSVHNSFRNWLF